jgi:proprotein convertase subtilisin/kexin type 5
VTNPALNNCAYCINSNSCEKCKIPYYLLTLIEFSTSTRVLSSQCVLNCPTGYFNNEKVCSLCNSTCVSCVNSANNCTSCQNGFYLFDFKCITNCPVGFYKSLINNICLKCNSLCYDCLNSTFCNTCISPYLTYQGKCSINCP